ncbi:MAG TPA: porin family protein [Chryseolinea sp.]|nr:porin family protein [Chryseolinea sp.]
MSRKRSSGDSYSRAEVDSGDVGFNCAYLMLLDVSSWKSSSSSFLQRDYKYREYQLLYAALPQTPHSWEKERYSNWGVLRHQSAGGKFLDHLGVLTGLEFVQKNSSVEDTKIRLSYLEVPILAVYSYDLNENNNIFGGFGPYIAYGVGGKIKGNGFSGKAFEKDFGYKRFDAGLTFTAGYKFNRKWSVRLAYDLGLVNLQQDSYDKTKNRTFSINLGYSPQFIHKLMDR